MNSAKKIARARISIIFSCYAAVDDYLSLCIWLRTFGYPLSVTEEPDDEGWLPDSDAGLEGAGLALVSA